MLKTISLAILLTLCSNSDPVVAATLPTDPSAPHPLTVQVQVENAQMAPTGAQGKIFQHPAAGADRANLLDFINGAQGISSGGVSSLPYLNGLGNGNLHIQVNGMGIPNACPNEMIPPLSYLPPSQIGRIRVYPTVAPVSDMGNAIGATILVSSPAPIFATPEQRAVYGTPLPGPGRSVNLDLSYQF